jgi:hypothetical protein
VVSRDDWRAVCAVLLGQQAESVPGGGKRKRASEPARASGSKRQGPTDEPERRVTRGQARAAATKAKQSQPEGSDEEGGGFIAEDAEDDAGGGFLPASGDEDEEGGFVPASDEEEVDGSDSDKYSDSISSDSEFGAPTRPKTTRGNVEATNDDSDGGVDEDWEDDMPRTLTVRQLREAKSAFALFFPDMDMNDAALNTKKLGIKEVAEAAKRLKESLSADDVSLTLPAALSIGWGSHPWTGARGHTWRGERS